MSDGLSKLQKVIVSDATGLVIDDDKSVCDLVSRLMMAMEFKQVLTASNGADGLKIAAECKPTVIVMLTCRLLMALCLWLELDFHLILDCKRLQLSYSQRIRTKILFKR